MKIISRSQWGAKAWRGAPHSTPLSSRTHFLVHYHGGPPPQSSGSWVPKNVEAIHLGNGWSGTGYSFMVGQDGAIYEGRGWSYVGAHCPGQNRTGIGVYVAIGGNQQPSEAAKRSVRWLYDEACRKTGRTLVKSWHGNHYATACPGPNLIAWVKAGMPASGVSSSGGGASAGGSDEWIPDGELTTKQIQQLVGVTVDGVYGPATKKAVGQIQKELGISADQLWGKGTEMSLIKKIDNLDDDLLSAREDLKVIKTATKHGLSWGSKEKLTPATAEAIGWGDRKNPSMSVGGQIMTTLRLSADAAKGVKRTEREVAKIADDVEALVQQEDES